MFVMYKMTTCLPKLRVFICTITIVFYIIRSIRLFKIKIWSWLRFGGLFPGPNVELPLREYFGFMLN